MGSIANSIAAAVEAQGAATAEIVRDIQWTSDAVLAVTRTIGGVAEAANETGAAASGVLEAAAGLSRQATQMTVEVNAFTADVRAA